MEILIKILQTFFPCNVAMMDRGSPKEIGIHSPQIKNRF
jgi:hypothetical protein